MNTKISCLFCVLCFKTDGLICDWRMVMFMLQEQLLHSMMSVFTFMGANILRQDDSYSFHVIERILETVFPTIMKVREVEAS